MKNMLNYLFNGIKAQYFNEIKSSRQKSVSIILFISIIFIYILYKNIILKSLDSISIFLGKTCSGKLTTTISNTGSIYPNMETMNNFANHCWSRCMKYIKT